MDIENDILDMIRDIPQEMNDIGTTTEFKFLTVGALLWQCYHEIKNLRAENRKLKERKK